MWGCDSIHFRKKGSLSSSIKKLNNCSSHKHVFAISHTAPRDNRIAPYITPRNTGKVWNSVIRRETLILFCFALFSSLHGLPQICWLQSLANCSHSAFSTPNPGTASCLQVINSAQLHHLRMTEGWNKKGKRQLRLIRGRKVEDKVTARNEWSPRAEGQETLKQTWSNRK